MYIIQLMTLLFLSCAAIYISFSYIHIVSFKVRHVIENGQIHLVLFSVKEIQSGTEVTIPFDFDFKSW